METQTCRKCGEEKPLAGFNKDRGKRLGVRRICKPCHRAEVLAYAAPKKAEVLRKALEWYKNNKDRKLAYDRANRPVYYKKKRAELLAKTNARRRRVRIAKPKWANDFFIREAYLLAGLRTRLTGIWWSVDHIIPLKSPVVCGLHWEGNLQVIPHSDNARKSNKLEWTTPSL